MDYPLTTTTLPPGFTVVSEPVPGAASVHLGVWLRCGARQEEPAESGLAHFLEHMAFKSGRTRDAKRLARDLETIGGQFDAYTTHDLTCYTLQVLPEHLPLALELLAELVIGGAAHEEHVRTERQVVLEEILEAEDSPSEVASERAARQAWGEHALGRPVLGSSATVGAFTAAAVDQRRRHWYTADRLVLAAVGAVEPARLHDLAAAALADLPVSSPPDPPSPPRFESGLTTQRLEVDQVHLCLAAPALAATDPDRWALWLLDSLFGVTMGSRLFQEVREQRGLCYHIASSWQGQWDVGMLCIEAAAHPKQVPELLAVVRQQAAQVVAGAVQQEELDWARAYSLTTVRLAAESLGARLGRLARGWLFEQRQVSIAETLAALEAVTLDDLQRVAQRVLGRGEWVLSAVGPVTDRRAAAWWKEVQS
ncbi:MAG: insulinase family protein [Fimbriimonadaceae bacterium]|nr:insulinase family protein [Fimbriimonadaceae bacterium]